MGGRSRCFNPLEAGQFLQQNLYIDRKELEALLFQSPRSGAIPPTKQYMDVKQVEKIKFLFQSPRSGAIPPTQNENKDF